MFYCSLNSNSQCFPLFSLCFRRSMYSNAQYRTVELRFCPSDVLPAGCEFTVNGRFYPPTAVRTHLPLIPCLPVSICTVIRRKCPPLPICPLAFSPSLFCRPFSFLSSLSTVSFSGFFSLYCSVSLFLLLLRFCIFWVLKP